MGEGPPHETHWGHGKQPKRVHGNTADEGQALLNLETAIEAYSMALLTRILGHSQEVAEKYCVDALAAAKNKNAHVYVHQ